MTVLVIDAMRVDCEVVGGIMVSDSSFGLKKYYVLEKFCM